MNKSKNKEVEYREMLTSIYENSLKYYAYSHFEKQNVEDLIHETYAYFLERFEHYKEYNLDRLTANVILKIKGLNIDEIRKLNAKSDIVEVINPGDAEYLEKEQQIHIRELKEINKELKKQNKVLVRYRAVVETSNFIDETEQSHDLSPEQIALFKQAQSYINKLEEKCKNLINSDLLGLKYKEIGEKYSMKIGTVMSSLSRCWDKLDLIKNA